MHTGHDILKRAATLAEAARRVLADLDLAALWSRAGRPVLVGSARFGLMTRPNIDFEIYAPVPDAGAGFSVIARLAAHPGVTRVEYRNVMGTADPGLYWRVFYTDGQGREWDIDNWLVPDDHPHAGMAEALAEAMEATLTDAARVRILAVKAELEKVRPVRGVDVYKAVPHGGAADAAGVLRHLADNPPPEMRTWRPGPALRDERA